ncbi:DJ-1/PfpI family protein [Spectribacter hydrogenoxidans]|uniref:DJ-1/PfpI family protein n=1 Tax=Spectribacter hydrogenoxidans TaxID=3075608 RepID=A0ABU3C2M5_9GAMM|nr:DJ-1/PfpI family protein [Salinisphaera sp. W335]MDT0635802.1 DJ-1/PfpI family protein [Salinisphaera sp. W335]
MAETRTLGAILFNDFELLDACGPLEMFGNLGNDLRIVTIAESRGPVKSVQGPSLLAEEDFDSAPPLDIILVPGGIGTNTEQGNPAMLAFLRERAPAAELLTSVCTGSAVLAASGVIAGSAATSNKLFFDLARSQSDDVEWRESARWVEDRRVFTSSGVSAGIDMALAVIARLFGTERAEQVAVMTEYSWHRDADSDPFEAYLNQGNLNDYLRALGRA